MTEEYFIKHITINNFKCFNSIKVENLRRVNLLGGDNNVGKSAFLEALEIVVKTENPFSLIIALSDIINRRQMYYGRYREFDVINYEQNTMQFKTNTISINLESIRQLSLFDMIPDFDKQDNEIDENLFVKIGIDGKIENIPYNKFSNMITKKSSFVVLRHTRLNENIDFIPATSLDELKLAAIYGNIVDMGMMEDINIFLREFDSRIEFLVIRPTEQHSVFKVKLRDRNVPVLLSSMGGGLNRYIAMVCAIWECKNGQLFIDEVENGIHYAKYEKFWEIIFKTSKKANCQVFATTHSKECIEAFSRVAEEYDHENIKYVNFSRTVDNPDKIVATVLDSVGLEDHFQIGLDVR